MTGSPPATAAHRPSPRICYCRDVDEAAIRAAIRAGAGDVDAVADRTGATTGCGTCRFDIEQLLADELARAAERAAPAASGRGEAPS
ncbi:MAG: (2Fe-2S)-binding protein [Planctomycetes bacterium]|nr:(2Fe-2S)-binding protein [Planctomycetota bacterium]